jgi:hypothetical protein
VQDHSAAYTCELLKFIACLEIAQAFHRYPVKTQLSADKVIIHVLLYRIALSGNSAFSIHVFANPLNTLAAVVACWLKLQTRPFCPQSILSCCIMYGSENKRTFPYEAFTVGLPDGNTHVRL